VRSMAPNRLRPLAVLSIVLAGSLSGCSLIGGNGDPRPDAPNATRPTIPAGAVTWSSLDWQSVTFEQPPKVSLDQWDKGEAVAAGPGGWVAVGSNGDVMGYEGRIWQSADSLSWKLVHSDLLAGLELVDVAATADSYVAIGTDSASVNDPATWILRSTDGLHWVSVKTIPGVWASRIASGPKGYVVVVQVDETNDLLLSPDGRTWTRVTEAAIGGGVSISDVAWAGDGWIAVGSAGDRAVALRSADGNTWVEESLPASGPVDGVRDVTAYRVIPGRWATLILGLDKGPSCAEDDDWCDQYQAAWSWTAQTGWMRLPRSTWVLGRGHGVDAFAAGDAGFLYLGDDVRTSADGWDWATIRASGSTDAFAADAVVSGDGVVAVGMLADGDALGGWFGSGLIRP
jgi:hypothetical protein